MTWLHERLKPGAFLWPLVLMKFSPFVTYLLAAHVYGARGYGTIVVVQAIGGIVQSISSLGLDSLSFNWLSEGRSKQAYWRRYYILRKAFSLALFAVTSVAVLVLVIFGTLRGRPGSWVLGVGLQIAANAGATFVMGTAIVRMRVSGSSRPFALLLTSFTIVQMVLRSSVVLAFPSYQTPWFVAEILSSVYLVCAAMVLDRYHSPDKREAYADMRFSAFDGELWQLFRNGLPLTASALMQALAQNVDRLVVHAVFGTAAAGQYGLASQFATAALSVNTEIYRVGMGSSARIRRANGAKIRWHDIRRLYAQISASARLISLAGLVVGSAVLLLLGKGYGQESIAVFCMLLIGYDLRASGFALGDVVLVFSPVHGWHLAVSTAVSLLVAGGGYYAVGFGHEAGVPATMLWVGVACTGGALAFMVSMCALSCVAFGRSAWHSNAARILGTGVSLICGLAASLALVSDGVAWVPVLASSLVVAVLIDFRCSRRG